MVSDAASPVCAICGKGFSPSRLRRASDTTPGTRDALHSQRPDIGADAYICVGDIARMRRHHLEQLLERERGALTALDKQVLESLESGMPLSAELEADRDDKRTFGERAADTVARFGGSWTFILGFFIVLTVWMTVNVTHLLSGPFDPYPFILLNLVLSCIAALQAPIIMMSQRRQEAKDRQRSESDYKINLKAELEIRHLHEKIDLHLTRQWERLAAIQRLQIEMLEESVRPSPPR